MFFSLEDEIAMKLVVVLDHHKDEAKIDQARAIISLLREQGVDVVKLVRERRESV